MSVMDSILVNFAQSNTIIKVGTDKMMSGELNLTNLSGSAVSVACYIGKRKRNLNQEVEGNVSSFEAYVMAKPDVNPTITTHDLLVTERGEIFTVGPVSQRNNGTTINGVADDATYLYADLELYSENA